MNIIKIKNKNFNIFILLLIYKLILDFVYVKFVNKLYHYMGFVLDFNIYKYIISFLWFVSIFTVLPKDNTKPSSIFLQLHFIIMIMPMFTTYSFANESNIFLTLSCICFILECQILRIIPSIKLRKIKNSYIILYWVIAIISVFVYISMIKANGIPTLKALNLSRVYEVRSIVKYPFLMEYLVSWQAKIINPFLITISYINKNKKLLAISVVLQLLIYLITALKAFLFIPLAIIIVIKILERDYFLSKISLLAPIGVLLAFMTYKLFGHIMFPSLIIRRLLFVPSQLKFFYFDFFSKNELLHFSEGVIGKIIGTSSPYAIKTANMIGYMYFGNIENNANTGYLADAYANMGILGMFVFSILFSMILILINSFSKNIKKELVIGLSLFSILALNDSALLTTLLTGGLLLLLLLLYLYTNHENDRIKSLNNNGRK
ncbi:hypothetical protein TR13x_04575 [Caloranaerobacter sp. TR13]|uniref:O-antigen polymerase n=1 Tax=Caloranaerobacter sp. TR13 TaxID=1302151 RepID=UPI0006D44033|nr:O-antigen polymerase [Caloranaerobacter sp. TR13]KPU27362.1 hypothetical protein TR13x_04575 [Caloranaerobacter sp. TR13]